MTEQAMPNPVELYGAAAKATQQIMAGVKPEQMDSSTPCTEWDVKALTDHIIGGAAFFASGLVGEEPQGPPQADSPAEAFGILSAKSGYSSFRYWMSIPNCVPQSPTWLTRSTLKPMNSRIRHTDSPMIVLRKWPTCISLAIFGLEKSTRHVCPLSDATALGLGNDCVVRID